jgi:hypothetical protein
VRGLDWVALGLVIVLGLALGLILAAVIVSVVQHRAPPILGEPSALVLTTALSGLIGVLGAYVGQRGGRRRGGEE